jgi:hypothetical protein
LLLAPGANALVREVLAFLRRDFDLADLDRVHQKRFAESRLASCIALHHPEHNGFVVGHAVFSDQTATATAPHVPVLIDGLPAHERLVYLDLARKLACERARAHRLADAVKHEPCGFLRAPSARPSSHDEVPFFVFVSSQKAGSHLENEIGESSKIVPTRAEN